MWYSMYDTCNNVKNCSLLKSLPMSVSTYSNTKLNSEKLVRFVGVNTSKSSITLRCFNKRNKRSSRAMRLVSAGLENMLVCQAHVTRGPTTTWRKNARVSVGTHKHKHIHLHLHTYHSFDGNTTSCCFVNCGTHLAIPV